MLGVDEAKSGGKGFPGRRNIMCKGFVVEKDLGGFPGGAVVESPPANAGDMVSSPGLGRSTCLGAAKPVSHSY